MKNTEGVVEEVHLYTNKMEAGIKVLIWIVSWAGGIFALSGIQDKTMLGSAYLFYSLSLLMEFVPRINAKIQFWNKLRHSIFCFLIGVVCVISIMILSGAPLSDYYYQVLSWLARGIIAYMAIDTFILWIKNENVVRINEKIEEEVSDAEMKFEKKLLTGNLGNISEGAKIDE